MQSNEGKQGFLDEIAKLKSFLEDPWAVKDDKKTVQVLVPKVTVVPAPPQPRVTVDPAVFEAEEMLSARNKRAAMQKKAAAASLVAEDYARRFELGEPVVSCLVLLILLMLSSMLVEYMLIEYLMIMFMYVIKIIKIRVCALEC